MLSRLTVGQSVDRYSIKCVGRLTLDQVCWSILGRLSTGIVADILIDISVDTSIHTPQKIHDHNTDLPGSVCNVTSFFLKKPQNFLYLEGWKMGELYCKYMY